MAYIPEERLRMAKLVKAFEGYIASNRDIDIAYAEKTGYVRLIVAEATDWLFFPIKNFDDMLEMFFYDVFSDELYPLVYKGTDYTLVDLARPYHRLRRILNTLDTDREYALKALESYMKDMVIKCGKQKDL